MDLTKLSAEDLQLVLMLTDAIDRREKGRKIDTFFNKDRELYKKHLEFFKAGAENKQRLLLAANRIGKTIAAAYELVLHLTGDYPDWWEGKRFTTCNHWWVVGKSSETVRQILQNELLGQVGSFGTGMVPMDRLDFESLADAKKSSTPVTSFRVKHKNGTYSTVDFKSAEQGRQAFEGTAKSIWMDEEAPFEIYTECLLRTMTGDNILMMTFTPLKGLSEVVLSFLEGGDIMSAGSTGLSKYVVRATWDDAPHLDEEAKKILLDSIPPFQRDARTKGVPQLGSGAIFPVPETEIVVPPFEIPKHWPRGYGFDVGRNTAAVWIAHDRESQTLYAYADWYQVEGQPSAHSTSIQGRGKWIRGAIDTAARGRSQSDGQNLFQIYKDLGLHIQNADKAVESGLLEMLELFTQGRLKVFSTCTGLLEELRLYRRDEKGQIVKKNDHRMDAFRYAVFTRDKILKTEAEVAAINAPLDIPYDPVPYSEDSWAV